MFPSFLLLSFLFIALLLPFGHVKADPLPLGNPSQSVGKTDAGEHGLSDASTVVLKKKHGYLEYDGTGYRLVNRTIKPEKAGYLRLKPLNTQKDGKGKPGFYTIEVIDEKKEDAEGQGKTGAEKPAGEKPRFAIEKTDDLDRKGVSMEPKKGHKADVGLGLKVSESSELIMGRGLVLERREDSHNMDARDDGWRFRFKTSF